MRTYLWRNPAVSFILTAVLLGGSSAGAHECPAAPQAVMEAALAHTVPDKTEVAYARSDLFARRRGLMEQGAVQGRQASEEVVPLVRQGSAPSRQPEVGGAKVGVSQAIGTQQTIGRERFTLGCSPAVLLSSGRT